MNFEGKIVAFLGDSITEGAGVCDIEGCRYDNRVARELGFKKVYNYGIGGTRIAHQTKPSEKPRYDLCFCGRAYNISKDAELIVVYGGVNDYIHGDAAFGTMEDTTPVSFLGGVDFLMNLLKTEYPDAFVVFMTPAHCDFKGVSDSEPSPRPIKTDARPLIEYVEGIKAKGAKIGIPVLDLFENLGLDPNDDEIKEKYTADGLHFNDEGHAYIAAALVKFLRSL